MAKRDIFDLTFDILQKSLSSDSTITKDAAQSSIEVALNASVLDQVHRKADARKTELANTRHVLVDNYKAAVKGKSNAISQTEGSLRLNLAVCKQFEHVMQRRLASQRSGSERRMKDLVFEVVGEYGKSNIRITRRQDYLRKTGRAKMVVAIWSMNWQKFALRLKFDLCISMLNERNIDASNMALCQSLVQCTHLSVESDKDEIESVIRKLTKKCGLISDKRVVVQSIVRITKGGKDKTLIQSSFRAATNVRELSDALNLLKAWVKKSSPAAANSQANVPSNPALAARNIASRGKSAGGARPRPLPVSSVPNNGPLLKELLSTAPLTWLHPSSCAPSLWDQVYHEQYTGGGDAPTASSTSGSATAEEDVFAKFARKYHAQHTSALWSDRAYFCLEERSLGTCSDIDPEGRAVSPDSALLAVLGDIAEASKDEKRVALENAITVQLLSTLQDIYVDHPYVYVTHAHQPLRCETPKESLKVLREILHKPLTVLGFSDKHRFCQPKPNAGKTTQIIYKYLPQFPDIMVVRAADGTVLHFAPAMLVHLPETRAFSSGCLSSDQMRQVYLRCPHPQLLSLSMPGCHYLSTLFCPVLSKLIESSNVLRDAPVSRSAPTMLSTNDVPSSSNQRSTKEADAKAANSTTVPGTKVPVRAAVLPPSPLYMMPLSNDGVQALMLQYLTPSVFARSHSDSDGISDVKDSAAGMVPSAINVLPDHARLRLATSSVQVDATSNATDDYRKLRCSYVLLPDDKVAENAAAAAAANEVSTPRRSSVSSTSSAPDLPKAKPPASPCYYLVQVYEMHDRTAAPSSNAGEGSEQDDHHDSNSTTFSLTQAGGGAPKSSIFGRSSAYHLEDDILRAIVMDELKAGLSCDVVISAPPVKPAQNTKDPKQQGARQLSIATDMGTKKGAFSSLGLVSASQQHNQVVQEDQDEGETGDNNDGSDGANTPTGPAGAGGTTSKRRWDPNVLSNVCRWRSCLCDSALQRVGKTSTFKQKQLCSYHLEMKEFLDDKGGKSAGQESAKYLPRKAPNFSTSAMQEKKRDMMTIRAASTLLQELWDGKLRATVRSFAKKVVRDMSPRVFLEASNTAFMIAHPLYMLWLAGNTDRDSNSRLVNPFSVKAYLAGKPAMEVVANSVVPAQPTWAIWKSKAYHDRTLEGQNLSLSILEAILLTEKTIYRELEMLTELRAYPSAELVLIRKEVKAFKDQQDFILSKAGENKLDGAQADVAGLDGQSAGGSTDDLASMLNSGYDDLVAILSAENKLCERKLMMMACRRQEEEERRALYVKKLARAKAQEDNQSRDPANFRNQRF